jgi:hypothetical protein
MKDQYVLRVIILSILCGVFVTVRESFPQISTDEQGVRLALAQFKKGIDSGDRALGPQLATGPYASQFISLYNMFVEGYQKYKMPLPMELGHIKILKDGRAKVETYLNPGRNLFVFTLVKEKNQWKFSHQEGILFPIFEFPKLPHSQILQLPQDKRGFMMAERDIAFKSYVYQQIKKDRGEIAARDFFMDGPGFKVAMDAWLPFLEGAGQFAMFLAVLESNYYGSTCVVTKATEEEAEVQLKPFRDLEVLKIAVFNPKLSPEEFRALYGHIMKNRAEACGLDIDISIQDTDCILKIRKK